MFETDADHPPSFVWQAATHEGIHSLKNQIKLSTIAHKPQSVDQYVAEEVRYNHG